MLRGVSRPPTQIHPKVSAPTAPDQESSSRLQRFWKEWRLPLLVLVALVLLRSCLVNHYVVPTGSMQPVLEPGNRVLVDMRAYGWRLPFTQKVIASPSRPQAGDVVLFFSPSNGVRLIKRVVATGGDEVLIFDGHLFVNGEPAMIEEGVEQVGSKRVVLDLSDGPGPDFGPLAIPEGKLLMVGDHRGDSLDGRHFGLVDENAVYGKAVRVFWRDGFSWIPF